MFENSNSNTGVFLVIAATLVVMLMLCAGGVGLIYMRTQTAARVAEAQRVEALVQQRAAADALSAETSRVESAGVATRAATNDPREVAAIEAVLDQQQDDWNDGDIDAFMGGYWQSDELTFSSGGSTTTSWQATLDRYRQKYDTPERMGKLQFDDIQVQLLGREAAFVLGRWSLDGATGGNFTLVFRKFPVGWRIVHDHTSVSDAP